MHALMLLLGTVLTSPGLLHAGAGAHDNRSLCLRGSIAIALGRNLTIRLAERDVQTAASSRDQALAGFLPKFSALLDYTYKSEAPALDPVPNSLTAPGLPPAINTALDNARISLGGQDVSALKVSLQQPCFPPPIA